MRFLFFRSILFYGFLLLVFDPSLIGIDPVRGRLAGLLMFVGGAVPDLVRTIREDGGRELLALLRQTLRRTF